MGEKSVQRWALVLGASSGIGEASARHAAEAGYNICGVYLGRSRGEKLDAAIEAVKSTGVEALYIRGNAADDEKRAEVLPMTKAELAQWRDAMKPVWKKFESDIGKDMIDAAVAANK